MTETGRSWSDDLGLYGDTNPGRCTLVLADQSRCPMVATTGRDRCDAHPRPCAAASRQTP